MTEKCETVSAEFLLSDGNHKNFQLPKLGGALGKTDSPERQALVAPISSAQFKFSINSDYECEYGLPKSIKYLNSNELLVLYLSSVLTARIDKDARIVSEFYLQDYILKKFAGTPNEMKSFIIEEKLLGLVLEEYILKEKSPAQFNGLCGLLNRSTKIRMNGRCITLREYIENFQIVYHIRRKKKSRETVRRKGYKDHGSLGSEFSRTLRIQAESEEFQDLARKELIRKINFEFPDSTKYPFLVNLLSHGEVGS